MTKWNLRSKRKATGKLLKRVSKKKKYQRKRDYSPTHVTEKKVVKIRTSGGSYKLLALSANIANVISKGKGQRGPFQRGQSDLFAQCDPRLYPRTA